MKSLFAICFATALSAAQNPIAWSLSGAPAKSGTSATARLAATIEPGWHLYGLTQPPGGPKATRIWVPDGQQFKARNEVKVPKPRREFDENFGLEVEYYEREAVFQIPVKLDGPSELPLKVNVYFQSCNDKICLPPKTVTITARD